MDSFRNCDAIQRQICLNRKRTAHCNPESYWHWLIQIGKKTISREERTMGDNPCRLHREDDSNCYFNSIVLSLTFRRYRSTIGNYYRYFHISRGLAIHSYKEPHLLGATHTIFSVCPSASATCIIFAEKYP